MRVFKAERDAGLADALRGPGRLLLTAKALPAAVTKATAPSPRALAAAAKFANRAEGSIGDPDLFPLNSVFVSTGWNLNHAVFTPEEVWAARHTPEDKPFNNEHDETDIIGHITAVLARDRSGDVIDDATALDDLPADFDLHTSAVLYRAWSDEALRERMDKIVAAIGAGELCVSMECLYRDFDYAVLDDDGAQNIISRNKATAFLTKRLKAFGGDGTYEGRPLGQVLKAFVFSGKGLTDNPANPSSVIYPYPAKARFYTSCAEAGYQPVNKSDEARMEQLTKQLETATAALAKAEADRAEVEKARAAERATLEKAKADADKALAEAQAEAGKVKSDAEALAKAKADADKAVEATKAEAEALKTKLAEAEKAAADTKATLTETVRVQAALKAGLDPAEAAELVKSQASLTDEQFAAGLKVLSAKVEKASKSKLPEHEPNPPTGTQLPDGKATAGTPTPTPTTPAETAKSTSRGLASAILKNSTFRKQPAGREE
jgi:phage shock protein A